MFSEKEEGKADAHILSTCFYQKSLVFFFFLTNMSSVILFNLFTDL